MPALTFGVSRSHAGTNLETDAQRFAEALGKRIGRRIGATVTRDYEKLLEGVLVGGISVAWMPPLLHARAARSGALLACVSRRAGAQGSIASLTCLTYRAAILVKRESDRSRLRDLVGARAAWADPFSASGYTFPRLHLIAAGIDPTYECESETFHGSVARACAAVADGAADFCAHFISNAAAGDPMLAQLELRRALGERVADGLRILDFTDPIPPDGIVLAAPLDGLLQASLRDALLSLDGTPLGRAAIGALLNATSLAPVTSDVARLIEHTRTVLASPE